MATTVGYTTDGATQNLSAGDYMLCTGPWTVPSGSWTATKATIRVAGGDAFPSHFRISIYNDNGGTVAGGTHVGTSAETSIATGSSPTDIDSTFSSPPALSGGQVIWIGVWAHPDWAVGQTTDASFYYDVFGDYPTHEMLYKPMTYDSAADPTSPFPATPTAANIQATMYLTLAGGPGTNLLLPTWARVRYS